MDPRIKILKESEPNMRPNWDEYFMHLAISIASRSTCHNVQAGTVIISENQIIGTGYNGAPGKIKKNCLETGCRKQIKGLKYEESLGSGECIGVHSEMNALGHLTKINNRKISVYLTIFPCHSCAKNLLSYDIEKIVFKKNYSEKEMKTTMDLFTEAGIDVFQLDMSKERYYNIGNGKNVKFGIW